MGLRSFVEEADVVSFAALVAVLMFLVFGFVGIAAAVVYPGALPHLEHWYTLVMPTITAIFVAYGIVSREDDGDGD